MRRCVRSLAAALGLLLAAGCGAANGGEAWTGTVKEAAWTVYGCEGVQIGIPSDYADRLIVETVPAEEAPSGRGQPLLSVSQRADRSHAGRETWLFAIDVLDQAGFEGFIQSDHSGSSLFAKDGERYYVYSSNTETGLDFVGVDSAYGPDSPEAKAWEALMAMGDAVRADMIQRNGLTPYSETDFFAQPFTYEGDHAYVRYYPYFTFDGDRRLYDQLVLSQPVRQGEGGVWCVERVYDVYGTVYPYFPDTGLAAADYYAQLQAEHDAGERTDLLTPLGAAKVFGAEAAMVRDTPADESFAPAEELDIAYMETNARVQHLVLDLMAGREADPLDLLDCAGDFTADTWGVLGRGMYGSDWWPPLREALGAAAVGQGQEDRDRAMLHLYAVSHGQFAEAVAGFLAAQRTADSAAYDRALAALPPAERGAAGAALRT